MGIVFDYLSGSEQPVIGSPICFCRNWLTVPGLRKVDGRMDLVCPFWKSRKNKSGKGAPIFPDGIWISFGEELFLSFQIIKTSGQPANFFGILHTAMENSLFFLPAYISAAGSLIFKRAGKKTASAFSSMLVLNPFLDSVRV